MTLGAEGYSTQTRYTAGLEKALPDFGGGRHVLGARYVGVRGRDGVGNDSKLQLTWTYSFGTGKPVRANCAPLVELKAANSRMQTPATARTLAVRPT